MYKIGIECEAIEEGQQWGLSRIITRLLQELAKRPELINEFRFVLYFKTKIPDYEYLKSPLFEKKIVRLPLISRLLEPIAPASFSIYYYILLPIKLYFEGLDLMYFPNYMLPIIFRGRSLIFLTEDAYYEAHYGSNPFRYRLAYRIFCWWAAKFGTRIMAMSNSSRREVATVYQIPESKISQNELGIDINRQHNTGHIHNTDQAYIFYLGQAFPRRHLRETMLAFEKIAPEFPDLKLTAVGYDKYSPPIIKTLQQEINQRLGREAIVHRDHVSEAELEDLYTNALSVVYVSSKEAFGLPPVEAVAYGSIPVVADTAVTREIFGEDAFFVKEPDSVDAIAEAIKHSLTDQHKRQTIKDSAARITSRYSWQAHSQRFLEIIRDICQNY